MWTQATRAPNKLLSLVRVLFILQHLPDAVPVGERFACIQAHALAQDIGSRRNDPLRAVHLMDLERQQGLSPRNPPPL